MVNWDAIYKQYQKDGTTWATLNGNLDFRFIAFVENKNFKINRALDIGCGTGKYLSYLEDRGIKADGLDSSPTAVKMTKKLVSPNAKIICADMYSFSYPKNFYDFIFSLSTIHHGYKNQVVRVILKIHASLTPKGKVFITLPNFRVNNNWDTFRNRTELAQGTYIPGFGPEKGLIHSFFTQNEVKNLFSKFSNVTLELIKNDRWYVTASK